MKFKKFFTALALSGFLLAGALFVGKGAEEGVKVVRATNVVDVTITEVRNAISTSSVTYLLPDKNYDLPDSWSYAYTAVGDSDGVFINGVKQNGASLKYAGTGSAFITFYYGLPSAASDGDVVEFKGTFATTSDGGHSFSIDYAAIWSGDTYKWTTYLGDITFDYANGDSIVTYLYGITSDTNAAPSGWDTTAFRPVNDQSGTFIGSTRKGNEIKKILSNNYYIGVSDATVGSIATIKGIWSNGTYGFNVNEVSFEWNGTNWVINIGTIAFDGGANGSSTINNIYGVSSVENIAPAGWESPAYAPVDSNSGTFIDSTRVGTEIKKINATTYYVAVTSASIGTIITVKGTWVSSRHKFTVAEISLQWTGYKWVNPVTDLGVIAFDRDNGNGNATCIYGVNSDPNEASSGWSSPAYHPFDNESGAFINGTRVGTEIKKVLANDYYIALSNVEEGSVVTIKGTWISDTHKFTVIEVSFIWNGSKWTVDYTPTMLARDLLKMTLNVCTGAGGNNKSALQTVWGTLSGSSYYGALSSEEKSTLASASGSSAIVVPTTKGGVNAMSDANALAAAMYRYDYCTSKYSLTNFIEGRSVALNNSILIISKISSGNVMQVVTITVSVLLVTGLISAYFIFRKKEDK